MHALNVNVASSSTVVAQRGSVPVPARCVRGGAAARAALRTAAAPSRRELLLDGATAASALLLLAKPALADDVAEAAEVAEAAVAADAPAAAAAAAAAAAPAASAARAAGRLAYLDVKLEGVKLGRVTVELLPDVAPVGAARFADLAVGKQGVGYRLARCGSSASVACRVLPVFLPGREQQSLTNDRRQSTTNHRPHNSTQTALTA